MSFFIIIARWTTLLRYTLAADRLARANKALNPAVAAVSPIVPKAKDPQLQGVFEAVYKWNEISQERTLLKLQEDKLLREDGRRQNEVGKIVNKVDDFAPFSEFQRRFDESAKTEREGVQKHRLQVEQQHREDLERFLSSILSHALAKPQAAAAATVAQNTTALSALEDQFAGFKQQALQQASEQQKHNSEAQKQIETLLSDHEKTTEKLNALDRDYKALKSEHNVLQSENAELKRQLTKLEPTNVEITQKIQEEIDQLSKAFQALVIRIDDVETKVSTFMEKVEELDMVTYNEVLETWIDHDFKNKVFSNDRAIATLQQSLQSMQESTASRFDKSDSLAQETRKALEAVDTVQVPQPQPDSRMSGDGEAALQILVDEKLKPFGEVLQKIVAESAEACADMVEEVRAHVDKIETNIGALERSGAATKEELVSQIQFLSQTAAQLETRFGLLEGLKLSQRLDLVGRRHLELEQKVVACQQNNANGGTNNCDALQIIKPDIDDAKRRFNALELAIRAINTQWSNLSSKQMAEMILVQLDPYGQRNEARIAKIEKEANELTTKLSNIEQSIIPLAKDCKRLTDITKAPTPEKRPASPGSPADESTKKRKLGENGQFIAITNNAQQ